MRKFNLIFVSSVIVATSIASLLIQNRAKAKFRENEIVLMQQSRQLAELASEHQRLSDLVDQEKSSSVMLDHKSDEVAKLRARLLTLQEQTNLLAKQLAEKRRAVVAQIFPQGQSDLLEHNHILAGTFGGGPRATGKLNDARALTAALGMYARNHQGEFPINLDQVAPYLPEPKSEQDSDTDTPLTGTNHFELVYQGSNNELSNIPPHMVALIREQQPWLTPNGKWARVYGYADGAANTVESDDNFQSWEAQHVVPPQSN